MVCVAVEQSGDEKAERNRYCELYPLGSILLRLDSFSVEW